ncbi:TIGR01244 family sulfur transferase [Aminobacter sp. BA135]|uniref:TIGR01244 family sulfur transferase n=1 Tax=Aminobacter sp. BA135 TaxID=537596 RepID=UPI003D791C32
MQDIKHITPDFAVSPQIAPVQLADLKAAGFTTVICNRPDHEDAGQPSFAEIKAAAQVAGLEAFHIPVTPGQATRVDVVAFDTAVTTAQGKVLAYCRTGARAQSLFAAIQG